jgi:hypothetical protein
MTAKPKKDSNIDTTKVEVNNPNNET